MYFSFYKFNNDCVCSVVQKRQIDLINCIRFFHHFGRKKRAYVGEDGSSYWSLNFNIALK